MIVGVFLWYAICTESILHMFRLNTTTLCGSMFRSTSLSSSIMSLFFLSQPGNEWFVTKRLNGPERMRICTETTHCGNMSNINRIKVSYEFQPLTCWTWGNQYNSNRCPTTSCNIKLLCGNLSSMRKATWITSNGNDWNPDPNWPKGIQGRCLLFDLSWGDFFMFLTKVA